MARPERSRQMESPGPTLLIVGACGALVMAGVAALAGANLRVPSRLDAETRSVILPTGEVFADGAPAYPSWAPEPLYPRAERDPMADFAAAWDEAMTDAPHDTRPVAFNPPSDLPPPYDVRMEGDARPIQAAPRNERQPPPADEGRYAYRGYDGPPPAAAPPNGSREDDKSRY